MRLTALRLIQRRKVRATMPQSKQHHGTRGKLQHHPPTSCLRSREWRVMASHFSWMQKTLHRRSLVVGFHRSEPPPLQPHSSTHCKQSATTCVTPHPCTAIFLVSASQRLAWFCRTGIFLQAVCVTRVAPLTSVYPRTLLPDRPCTHMAIVTVDNQAQA